MDEHKYVRWAGQGIIEPSCFDIQIEFDSITESHFESLKMIFNSWNTLGVHGAFDGLMHFVDSLEINDTTIKTFADLGSADPEKALDTLEVVINQYAKDEKIVINKMMLIGD